LTGRLRASRRAKLALHQLDIPFAVVFDADRGPESAALDGEIRQAAGQAPLIRLKPNFEAVAGIFVPRR
jgi:hypothetical protein